MQGAEAEWKCRLGGLKAGWMFWQRLQGQLPGCLALQVLKEPGGDVE